MSKMSIKIPVVPSEFHEFSSPIVRNTCPVVLLRDTLHDNITAQQFLEKCEDISAIRLSFSDNLENSHRQFNFLLFSAQTFPLGFPFVHCFLCVSRLSLRWLTVSLSN